jgi:hypothetical protein
MSPAPRPYKVGHARASSSHQKLDSQCDALNRAGCHKVFWDPQARGRTGGRPRTDPDKLEQACPLHIHSDKTAAEVYRMAGIGRRTSFSDLAHMKEGEPIFCL